MELVRRATRDAAVIVIEHDLRAIARADRVVVMDHGRLLASGQPAVMQRDLRVIAAYLGPDSTPTANASGPPAPGAGGPSVSEGTGLATGTSEGATPGRPSAS